MAKVMKSGTFTTLALVMAATSAPAMAQDSSAWHREGGDHNAAHGEAPRGEPSGQRAQAPAPAAAPARTAPQVQNGYAGQHAQRGEQGARGAAPQGTQQNAWQRAGDGYRGDQARGNENRGYDARGDQARGNEARGNQDRNAWQQGQANGDRREWQGGQRPQGQANGDRDRGRYGYNGGGANGAQRWNRDWRSDRRYDWGSYRNGNRDTYRLSRYYAPYRGWDYRRIGVGFDLQPLFYGQSYWIGDPFNYRLPPAYGPYRWVRYYNDALLVNIYNGEVVDAVYGIFW